MQEVIDYIRANPAASTNDLRELFGMSKARAFELRKTLGVAGSHISPEKKAEIRAYLETNPEARPADTCRLFGVTAMVLKRLRAQMGLLGASDNVRLRRDEAIASDIREFPRLQTRILAERHGVTTDIIERVRNRIGVEAPGGLRQYHDARTIERADAGIVRREDCPARSGVQDPVPVVHSRERWERIPGELGERYSVSNYGRVRNDSTNRIMKQYQNVRGYWCINLYAPSGVRYVKRTHRLVAEAFIPNPLGKPEVNHRNGNTGDPRRSNLEWATKAENMTHASREGLFTVARISPATAERLCAALSVRRSEGKSIADVAREHNVPLTLLERISARKTWISISCKYQW